MIGPVVRSLRLERNLSQEALARAASVSSGYLSKLERGLYKEPSYDVLSRIAGALSIPTAGLYSAAGLDHLLAEADPAFEPVLEPYARALSGLPKRDRQIITSEIRRIVIDETRENGHE
jgi:transcriptional regulator with XRE-family HTH domain